MYKQKALMFIQKGKIQWTEKKFTQEVLKSENTMYHIAKGMLKSESDCERCCFGGCFKGIIRKYTLLKKKSISKRGL